MSSTDFSLCLFELKELGFQGKHRLKSVLLFFMILARVVGNIVATQKNVRYENARVMLCQQITPEGEDTSYSCLALDSVDSGVGDTVLIVQEGWSASTASTGKAGAAIDSRLLVWWITSTCWPTNLVKLDWTLENGF
jgi:ethanolamine utilization protein EutN